MKVPSFVWTEEYLQEAMQQYFKAFDHLRAKGVPLIGEMIWNFADFMSKQGKLTQGIKERSFGVIYRTCALNQVLRMRKSNFVEFTPQSSTEWTATRWAF